MCRCVALLGVILLANGANPTQSQSSSLSGQGATSTLLSWQPTMTSNTFSFEESSRTDRHTHSPHSPSDKHTHGTSSPSERRRTTREGNGIHTSAILHSTSDLIISSMSKKFIRSTNARTLLTRTVSNSVLQSLAATTVIMSDSKTQFPTTLLSSTVVPVGSNTTISDSQPPFHMSSSPSGSNTTSISPTENPVNYKLILYIVPPLGVIVLLLVIVFLILCVRRYRRIHKYRRHLIPLTDRDGSDDSDEEEVEFSEPAFMVTPMARPMLAFTDT